MLDQDTKASKKCVHSNTVRFAMASLVSVCLSACGFNQNDRAPYAPDRQWQAPQVPDGWMTLAVEGVASNRTPMPGNEDAVALQSTPLDLPALIDLAQRNNPSTRIAWLQARQAATAVGMVEATYLPMLSAYAVGGYASRRQRFPEVLGQRVEADSNLRGRAPFVTLQWLLFDFGERAAAHKAAEHLSTAANFGFNAIHQKLIYDTTRTYYTFVAARDRSALTREALANSRTIAGAVGGRRQAGLATSVENAQANQLVEQSRLNVVIAEGAERDAYQALLSAVGSPPYAKVEIASADTLIPPTPTALPQGALLQRTLADRQDVLASIAALKAAEEGVVAARADFLPKVFLTGMAGIGHSTLEVGQLPGLSSNSSTNAVLLGVALPIFDGGMRASRLQRAQEQVRIAEASLTKLRDESMREMVVAANLTETAMQANEVSTSLVKTATITYDAALDAYKLGAGTVDVAATAAENLRNAQMAQVEARASAFMAAATLAFALGRLE